MPGENEACFFWTDRIPSEVVMKSCTGGYKLEQLQPVTSLPEYMVVFPLCYK